MSYRSLFGCVLLVAAGACASSKGPQSGASDGVQQSATGGRTSSSRNRDLITREDIDAEPSLRASTALEVVRALRPTFLNDHGGMRPSVNDPEAGQVHVSINGGRIVPVTELNEYHGNDITEIRYLSAGQAQQKFGTASRQGPIILVTTTTK